jgi:hypothetical protein
MSTLAIRRHGPVHSRSLNRLDMGGHFARQRRRARQRIDGNVTLVTISRLPFGLG